MGIVEIISKQDHEYNRQLKGCWAAVGSSGLPLWSKIQTFKLFTFFRLTSSKVWNF